MVRDPRRRWNFLLGAAVLLLALVNVSRAQTCYTGGEIDASTAKAVEAAAQQYFNMSAQGDVAGLRAHAIPAGDGEFWSH